MTTSDDAPICSFVCQDCHGFWSERNGVSAAKCPDCGSYDTECTDHHWPGDFDFFEAEA